MRCSKTAAIVAITILAIIISTAVFESILSSPMVVSSRSMQHDDYKSSLGTLDTGDLVIIDYMKDVSEVKTYAQAVSEEYVRFGSYGDVILFETELTEIPIIHRAICRIDYNGDGTFSIPELSLLPEQMWSTNNNTWENISGKVYLYDVGYKRSTVPIDLNEIRINMADEPHGGILTMGDNNISSLRSGSIGHIDQTSLSSVHAPIENEDILGVAAAEIPWAGTLKLIVSGNAPDYMPKNSIFLLSITVSASVTLIAAAYLLLKRK